MVRYAHNGKLAENIAKDALKRYQVKAFGGVDKYNCMTEHVTNVLDFACIAVDALAASSDTTTRTCCRASWMRA